MTEKDARIAREVMVDELNTINKYESMTENADSEEVRDVVKDIAREEKVHVGEAAALLDRNDPEAKDAMLEGVKEVGSFKESVQATFENGEVGIKKPKKPPMTKKEALKKPGYFDNTPWASLSDEQKKKIDPERYEEERDEHFKSKKASASFRDVFERRRGEVIAKANGVHVEKDANWKHAGPEAVDYVEQKKMPNTEFLRTTDHPMESIESYREANGPLEDDFLNKPSNAIYGSKYTPTKTYDSGWKEFTETEDFMDRNEGEIYTVHPDSRGLIIHTPEEYYQFLDKYLKEDEVVPLEEVERELDRKGYSGRFREIMRRDLENRHPSYVRAAQDYDWIYFPDPKGSGIQGSSFTSAPILDTNSLIMLNDYLQDGKTPTRILQRPYTPRDQRVAQGRQDDSRHDYVPEEDVPLGFMAEGGREAAIPTKVNDAKKDLEEARRPVSQKEQKIRHADTNAETKGLVDRKQTGRKEEKKKEEKLSRTTEYGSRNEARERKQEKAQRKKDIQAKKKRPMTQKEFNDKLARMSPAEREAYLKKLKEPKKLTTFGNDSARKSASTAQVRKASKPQTESRIRELLMHNKKASPRLSYSLGTYYDPFKGYFNTHDPATPLKERTKNGYPAYRMRFDPYYGQMHPSGRIYVTYNPDDFSEAEWQKYNKLGNRPWRPTGKYTSEDYTTVGGTPGSTQQVKPIRVSEKDMHGRPVYDEVRRPRMSDQQVVLDDGTLVYLPVVDSNGEIVYDTVRRTPRYVNAGNLIMTQKGKDLSYLQRYTGKLDTVWDPKTRQWIPKGIRLDEKGQVPDEIFQDIYDENGQIDPELAMAKLREYGYAGNDNRWNPDISAEQDDFYEKEAYRQLVKEGVFGPKAPSYTDAAQELIAERAAQIRAEDEQRGVDRRAADAQRRSEFLAADEQLKKVAQYTSDKILNDWLDEMGPYEMDEETDEVVFQNGRRYPVSKLEAWAEANTYALMEQYRLDRTRKATEEEKTLVQRARDSEALTTILADYYYGVALSGLDHEPNEAERTVLRDKAHRVAEKIPFEAKAIAAKKLGHTTPAEIEHLRTKDWADTRTGRGRKMGVSDPLYMHPDDIYHQTLAHEEDIERMRADAERTGKRAQQDRFYIDTLKGIAQLSDQIKNENPILRGFELALDDMRAGRLQLNQTDDGGYGFIYLGKDQDRLQLVQDALDVIFNEDDGYDLDDLIGSSFNAGKTPETAVGSLISMYNKRYGSEVMYEAARQKGFSPKAFEYLVNEAGLATRRQNAGGNNLAKVTDQELKNRLGFLLDSQGASMFGGDIDNDVREAWKRKKEDEDVPSVIEATLPEVLDSIKDNYRRGEYKRLMDPSTKDLQFMDTLMGWDDDAQLGFLDRLRRGRLENTDPSFSHNFESKLRRDLMRAIDNHSREGLIEEIIEEFGPRMTDYLTGSQYRDAANVTGENVQAEVPEEKKKELSPFQQKLVDKKDGKKIVGDTAPDMPPAKKVEPPKERKEDNGITRPAPKAAQEKDEPPKDEKGSDDETVEPTAHKEDSFRDVFTKRRDQVLKKYHGI